MISKKNKALSNHEVVTLAVYLLGGETQRIDTEDIAVKSNELAPGRFTWRKYRDQISIDSIRKRLWDASQPEKGSYLYGGERDGWGLTPEGLAFARAKQEVLAKANLTREPMNAKERISFRRERERMLSSDAFAKFSTSQAEEISAREAESFFRVDAYVTGDARMEKILRAKNRFGEDPELGPLIKLLESKLTKGE